MKEELKEIAERLADFVHVCCECFDAPSKQQVADRIEQSLLSVREEALKEREEENAILKRDLERKNKALEQYDERGRYRTYPGLVREGDDHPRI